MKKHIPGEMFNAFQKKKKNWIAGAIKHPGALHRSLGVKAGNKIPAGKLASAAKKGGKLGRRARLAETLKGFKHKKYKLSQFGSMENAGKPINIPSKAIKSAAQLAPKVAPNKPSSAYKVNLGPVQPWRDAKGNILKKSKRKMTEAQDRAYDRKHGIKEDSKRDIAQDKRMGVKQKKMCKKHHKVMCKKCK
jgi:hypothetical protein